MASSQIAKIFNQCKMGEHKSRPRARSCHRYDKDKLKSNRYRSSERYLQNQNLQKKNLNTESKYALFLSASEVFENTVNQLEIDDTCDEVYEKLLDIQKLIKKKISSSKDRIRRKNSDLKSDLEIKNYNIFKPLTSSLQSLNLEESELDNCLGDDSFSKEFLIKVNCPFCLKSQTDKINLIKHLDKNCEPYAHNKFEKNNHIPFSTFQILPNNAFKCNICRNSVQRSFKQYITHIHTESHVATYAKAAQTKFYSDYLFCSCCKVQVANNYTELDFHIKHEIHKIRSDGVPNSEDFLQKRIYCVYIKSKKFKCLVCPYSQSLCDTPKDILQHFEEPKHIKNLKKNVKSFSLVYCEFCLKAVHIFEIISHFNEREHKMNVDRDRKRYTECKEIVSKGSFELCLYCGLVFCDLMALSWHMKSKCQAINEIREKNLKPVKTEEKNLQRSKGTDESKVADGAEEECHIIVKGNVEIPKLFKYFTKFGEVIALETHEKDVKIKFREKKTVEDILLLRNVLQVEGVKIEVTTEDGNFCKSNETINSININTENFGEHKRIGFSHTIDEDGSDETDSSEVNQEDDELKNLFKKVSSHLINNTQKLESEFQKKIVQDCIKTLQVQTCDFVGFSGCGLSFSAENINLYCKIENKKNIKIHDFESNLIKLFYLKMCHSELWKSVIIAFDGSFSHIKCVHKETQKACTVIFDQSAMMLTNMLRNCLENNDAVQSFCLIIRFWLSVHELKIRDCEYTIISILVFFLISQKIVNIPADKYLVSNIYLLDKIVKEKPGCSKSLSDSHIFDFDVKELFQRFLLFLDTFDFDKYAICLPIQHPVPKALLMEDQILNVPNSDKLLKSSMCILDLVLFRNVAEDVNEEEKSSLLRIVRNTIKHYKIQ